MDLIFDFDGTLFDTYPSMVESFKVAGTKFELVPDLTVIYQQMRQHSLGYAIKEYTSKNSIDPVDFRKYYDESQNVIAIDSKPFSGVPEVLEQVIQHGGKNFLLTHRDQMSQDILDKNQLEDLFTEMVTSKMKFPRKPDPASMSYLINKYNLNKKTTLMVGDRNLDIKAAHNAGIRGVLFDPDHLIDPTSIPDFSITVFDELLNIID